MINWHTPWQETLDNPLAPRVPGANVRLEPGIEPLSARGAMETARLMILAWIPMPACVGWSRSGRSTVKAAPRRGILISMPPACASPALSTASKSQSRASGFTRPIACHFPCLDPQNTVPSTPVGYRTVGLKPAGVVIGKPIAPYRGILSIPQRRRPAPRPPRAWYWKTGAGRRNGRQGYQRGKFVGWTDQVLLACVKS